VDLEALWQTHKRFVIKVAAGALMLLIGNGWQSSVQADADRLTRQNASAQGDLVSMIEALRGAEGLERGRAEALEKRLAPAIQEAILWRPDAAYALPPGDKSPALFYASAANKAVRKVEDAAAGFHADVPRDARGLGLPGEVAEGRVVEALAQVDVVERLVRALVHAGVRRVTTVQPGEVRYASLGAPKAAGKEGEGEAASPDAGRHLRLVTVRVGFTGSTLDLAKVLSEVETPGSFLEVVECQVERESDKPGAAVQVTLDLQALSVVDQLPASAKMDDAARPSRRPRRTFVRER
jgi:hypothetical protein